jgi:hypothetical protein
VIDDSGQGRLRGARGPLHRLPLVSDESPALDQSEFGHANGMRSGFPAAGRVIQGDGGREERLRSRFAGWDPGTLPDESEAPPLADGMELEDEDAPSAGRRVLAMMVFFCIMAAIGSGSGAIWYYCGPDWVRGGTQVDEAAATLARLADEERKLTQSIAALQLVQDSLQKHVLAGEQELQRLSTEVRSLRSDVENLRTLPPGPAGQASNAQPPRSVNRVPAKKNKPQPKPTAEPKGHAGPLTVSPQPQ